MSVLCVAALMTACGGSGGSGDSGDSGGDVDSLEMWLPSPLGAESTDAEKTAYEGLLEPFEKDNDVTVNLTLIPWDSYEEKYLTGVSSGQGPDVGYMYTEMMGDYIKEGALTPSTTTSMPTLPTRCSTSRTARSTASSTPCPGLWVACVSCGATWTSSKPQA